MYRKPYMIEEEVYAKINNNPADMPVVVENVGHLHGYGEIISIAHYGKQNGDAMADSDMEFVIISGDYYPISYRNDYLCQQQDVFSLNDEGKPEKINKILQQHLTTFTELWHSFRGLGYPCRRTFPASCIGRTGGSRSSALWSARCRCPVRKGGVHLISHSAGLFRGKWNEKRKIDLKFAPTALYFTEHSVKRKPFVITGAEMGQQLNKIVKRSRRKAYLERCKAKVRSVIAAVAKKK